jgi:hypothetical protein
MEQLWKFLDRFDGRHGKIAVVQERTTGARLYLEGGVKQSYVLPGGSAVLILRCLAAVGVRLPQSCTAAVVA